MSLPGVPLQIVLAEDNPADVMLVRLALKEAEVHCELHVMDDGDKAFAFITALDADPQSAPIDLLLLDMHLPKRDGEEIVEWLRSTRHHAQTPVIFMTGSDAERDHDQAKKHAVLHYFRKPSDFAEFMELGVIIRNLLVAQPLDE